MPHTRQVSFEDFKFLMLKGDAGMSAKLRVCLWAAVARFSEGEVLERES